MTLHTDPRPAPLADDLFEALASLYDGLNETEAAAATARLVLILTQHVGDPDVIRDAVAVARKASET